MVLVAKRGRRAWGGAYRRVMLLVWLVVGGVLGGLSVLAFAEVIDAPYYYASYGSSVYDQSSPEPYCVGYLANVEASQNCMVGTPPVMQPFTKIIKSPGPYARSKACQVQCGGADFGAAGGVPVSFVCPGGVTPYTTDGWATARCNVAACGPGFTRASGTGVCSPNCPSGRAMNPDGSCAACGPGEGMWADGTCYPGCPVGPGPATGTFQIGSGNIPDTFCKGGCEYEGAGVGVGLPGVGWGWQAGNRTGKVCAAGREGEGASSAPTASDGTPSEKSCAEKGEGFATMGGVTVCSGPSSSTKTTSSKVTTTPTSTTTSTTTTSCRGSECSTTTTSTYTSGGSGPGGTGPGSTTVPGTGPGTSGEGEGEVKEDESKDSFCQENPDSPICKISSFGGACAPGASPTCDGDAVQCAQAAEAWKIRCALLTEPTDAAYLKGKAIAAGGSDDVVSPVDPTKVATVDVAGIVTAAGGVRTLSASCIPSPTFSVMGSSFTLDTSLFCEFASIIGYMMVAASTVIAVRMIA